MSEEEVGRDRVLCDVSVQHLPCQIQYTGGAPISTYFVVNGDKEGKEATFRGRLLKGEVISLPENITGRFGLKM